MKKTDIFIRTYKNDLEFLKYCLRSIQKFVTGYNQIIICIPEEDAHLLDDFNLTQERIVKWKPLCENGYIDQQLNKLCACNISFADYILFVDSDVCFFEPTDLSEYFVNDKPYLMKTDYRLVGDAICWQKPTEEILNLKVNYEYMRRIPLLYNRLSLHRLLTKVDVRELAKLERLSEFNLIGAFIAEYEPENYHFINTEFDKLPKACAKQFWSWGGLTPQVINELETFLK